MLSTAGFPSFQPARAVTPPAAATAASSSHLRRQLGGSAECRWICVQITTFEREGWLLVKDFIPRGYIVALQAEIERVIDGQARKLFAEGKITDLHEDKDYLTRTAAIWDECPEIWSPVYSGNHAGKAMFELLSCDEMLDIMEQLVGPEIVAAGIYRLRPKLPDRPEGIVPWHQVS